MKSTCKDVAAAAAHNLYLYFDLGPQNIMKYTTAAKCIDRFNKPRENGTTFILKHLVAGALTECNFSHKGHSCRSKTLCCADVARGGGFSSKPETHFTANIFIEDLSQASNHGKLPSKAKDNTEKIKNEPCKAMDKMV